MGCQRRRRCGGGGGGNEGRVRRMRRVGVVVDVENQEGYLECRSAAACGPLGDQVPPMALIGSVRPYLGRSREAVLFHTGLRSLTRYSSTFTRKHSKYTTLVLVHHVNYYDGDSGRQNSIHENRCTMGDIWEVGHYCTDPTLAMIFATMSDEGG